MSSLVLVPALLRQLSSNAKLAIVTADAGEFSEDLLGISDPAERARVVVGGIEHTTSYRNMMMDPPQPTELRDIEEDVAGCIEQLRAAHPEIGAVVVTCTGLPIAMPAIRRATALPVYDITTICRLTLESVGA
ncbi:hypothetical protein CK221_29420 [Mesorhizobium sp. WSM3868]|nr:hypothetical protein CK221_29420 [Mesorhizobium sp. WSM3868]